MELLEPRELVSMELALELPLLALELVLERKPLESNRLKLILPRHR
jgi:hypothetical protein